MDEPTDISAPTGTRRATASKSRLAVAFAVAAISDALSAWLTMLPLVQWGVDLVTAALLFFLLGRQWAILPGLVAEAIPGVAVFPAWILVVAAVAAWGTVRRPRG